MFFFGFMLVVGALCLAIGVAYFVSPRFVEWTVTNDRRGQQWARLLGRERAIYAMRRIFSLILIAVGIIALCASYLSYGSD